MEWVGGIYKQEKRSHIAWAIDAAQLRMSGSEAQIPKTWPTSWYCTAIPDSVK
jgi:hypothetical protein